MASKEFLWLPKNEFIVWCQMSGYSEAYRCTEHGVTKHCGCWHDNMANGQLIYRNGQLGEYTDGHWHWEDGCSTEY